MEQNVEHEIETEIVLLFVLLSVSKGPLLGSLRRIGHVRVYVLAPYF